MQIKTTITTLLLITVFLQTSQAQISELWGTTGSMGNNGAGSIYKTDGNGNNLSVEYHLEKLNANRPMSGFTEALDGFLYTCTQSGGIYGRGTIIKMDPSTEEISVVYNFSTTDGSSPIGTLELASNGKLIGVTKAGGTNSAGVLYEFDYTNNTLIVLHEFTVINSINGSIVEASNGLYYGLTINDGTNNEGSLYSYDPVNDIYSVLYSFQVSTGGFPFGQLIQASNGKLYGMANNGGTYNYGVIYEYDITLDQYTVLHNFTNTEESYPSCTLLEIANGNIVGTTLQGGVSNMGVLFEYDFINGFNVLYNLGLRHYGELIESEANVVWGTGRDAYANYGKFFSYDLNSSQYFNSSFTYTSAEGLVLSYLYQLDNQYMYALTNTGGITNSGTVVKYDYVNDIKTKIEDFNFAENGEKIDRQLVHAGDHLFFGVCEKGGVDNLGVLFSYDALSGQYTKLHDFDLSNGQQPKGPLLLADNGLLYGTTKVGGANNRGILYSFDYNTNTFTKLYDFVQAEGSEPNGELIQATDGKLYGMCYNGGANNVGVIFEYDINTNSYQNRYDFEYNTAGNGRYPSGGLTEGIDNMLYGLTQYSDFNGSEDYGAIIEFNSVTGQLTKLHNFNQTDGESPLGNVSFDTNGLMYGTTSTGGASNNGIYFSYDTLTNTFTNLTDFVSNTSGAGPNGRLIKSISGNFYGVLLSGGSGSRGTLYEYDVQSQNINIKYEFDDLSGAWPNSGPIEVLICMPSTGVDIREECDEFVWIDNNTYTSSNNVATHVLPGSLGCDSTVTLNLTIKSSTSSTQIESAIDEYTWPVNNQTYTSSGQYTAVIPNAANCDSTITLDLTLQFTGLDELNNNVTVYPIPANNQLIIKSPIAGDKYSLVDLYGREVLSGEIENELTVIDVSQLMKGSYFLIFNENKRIKIIKQ